MNVSQLSRGNSFAMRAASLQACLGCYNNSCCYICHCCGSWLAKRAISTTFLCNRQSFSIISRSSFTFNVFLCVLTSSNYRIFFSSHLFSSTVGELETPEVLIVDGLKATFFPLSTPAQSHNCNNKKKNIRQIAESKLYFIAFSILIKDHKWTAKHEEVFSKQSLNTRPEIHCI